MAKHMELGLFRLRRYLAVVLYLASLHSIVAGQARRNTCYGGVYTTLWRSAEGCMRDENIHPDYVFRRYETVSGEDYLRVYADYCQHQGPFVLCLNNTIERRACLEGTENELADWLAISSWMCDGNDVKDPMKDLLLNLPTVSLNRHDSVCFQISFETFYSCLSPFPRNGPDAFKSVMTNMLSALPCAITRLSTHCPREEALMYVLVDHQWLFFPPAIGLNVSAALLNAFDSN